MKTQLFILLIIAASIFSNNSFASTKGVSSEKSEPIPVEILSTNINQIVSEESLAIEDWMINDTFWKQANEITFQFDCEEELKVEEWMTNTSQWELGKSNFSNVSTIEDGNTTIHIYRLNKEKEEALSVEGWMTDDNVWSL